MRCTFINDPKTGQPALLTVHAKDRFVGDRIAERSDTAEWHTPFPKDDNAKVPKDENAKE
jgi:hypothetical protein